MFEMMEKETSKRKILRSAEALFCEKGFKGASVRAIAKEAEVNIASISYYFGGKRELYLECLRSFGKEILNEARNLLEGDYTPKLVRSRLMVFTEFIFRKYLDNPELVYLVLKEVDSRQEQSIDSLIETLECLVKFFKKLKENLILKPELKPEIVASLYMAALINSICTDEIKEQLTGHSMQTSSEYCRELINHIVEVYLTGVTELHLSN